MTLRARDLFAGSGWGVACQRANWREWVPEGGKITIEQAAVLQTYPSGFAFAGTKGRQFEQVGNAVPPPLAEALLSTFL